MPGLVRRNTSKGERPLAGLRIVLTRPREQAADFEARILGLGGQPEIEAVEAIKKAGLTPEPQISLAGSDANSLNAKGIESVNFGIGAQNPHSNNEFILIEDLHKSAAIALELIKN
jgi:acetylornithine deacetylase/succinyl-diaminopimelate desuccinylase-like protein